MTVPPNDPAALEQLVRALEAERDQLARALADARAALRLREDIFAAVVHDLRNPLGTVVMGATALLGSDDSDPRTQRVRTVAERIARQAERMTRQLANLSDFSEIEAGRLVLDRAPAAPASILAGVRELIAPLALERGVGLEIDDANQPVLRCDAERVVQAIANLAGTALKVTSRGGTIEIGARPGGFYVRDHAPDAGPGRGAELALTIARGIAEAHGGRLASERTAAGHTVTLALVE